jgi:hypothetical protein
VRTCAALLACAGAALSLGVVSLFAASAPSVPSLAPPALYTAAARAWTVAIGDLNGDGKSDLVTANYDGVVSVLLNRGEGSFRAKRDDRTSRGPESIAIGDLDGDGKPDIVTARTCSSTPTQRPSRCCSTGAAVLFEPTLSIESGASRAMSRSRI